MISCGEDPITPTPTGPQQYGTPLSNVPNVDKATIYEVNLRAQSSEGNLQGVISKLQHIKSLGTVNAIGMAGVTSFEFKR